MNGNYWFVVHPDQKLLDQLDADFRAGEYHSDDFRGVARAANVAMKEELVKIRRERYRPDDS